MDRSLSASGVFLAAWIFYLDTDNATFLFGEIQRGSRVPGFMAFHFNLRKTLAITAEQVFDQFH
jgi:hypothetical protein